MKKENNKIFKKFGWRKHYLRLYALSHLDNPEIFLTISTKKEHITEYLLTLLRVKNDAHYQLWLQTHGFVEDTQDAWNLYISEIIPLEEKNKYQIKEILYKIEDVCAIMRMFAGCVPLNCSFENSVEQEYLMQKLAESNEKIFETSDNEGNE